LLQEMKKLLENNPDIVKGQGSNLQSIKGSLCLSSIFRIYKLDQLLTTNLLHKVMDNSNVHQLRTINCIVLVRKCKCNIGQDTRRETLVFVEVNFVVIDCLAKVIELLLNEFQPKPLNNFTVFEMINM